MCGGAIAEDVCVQQITCLLWGLRSFYLQESEIWEDSLSQSCLEPGRELEKAACLSHVPTLPSYLCLWFSSFCQQMEQSIDCERAYRRCLQDSVAPQKFSPRKAIFYCTRHWIDLTSQSPKLKKRPVRDSPEKFFWDSARSWWCWESSVSFFLCSTVVFHWLCRSQSFLQRWGRQFHIGHSSFYRGTFCPMCSWLGGEQLFVI